jgi:deoxycytidylate deaminase
MSKARSVNIRGTEYTFIAARLNTFNTEERFKHLRVLTEVLERSDDRVFVQAKIVDDNDRVIRVGHAEEERGGSNINATSALENCETSAVGRALGFLDPDLTGTQISSAEEVNDALIKQAEKQALEDWAAYSRLVREHWDSISAIKTWISDGNLDNAVEAYIEIPYEDLQILWRAPTKGGVFTTEERNTMKSNEWHAAVKQYREPIQDTENGEGH